MVYKNLTPGEIEKKREEVFAVEGEDCIDKMLTHIKNVKLIHKKLKIE